ncbi:MAG TPA: hypothetical protein VGF70_09545 [Solirubrobacteraceae bacterium]
MSRMIISMPAQSTMSATQRVRSAAAADLLAAAGDCPMWGIWDSAVFGISSSDFISGENTL